jgi:hypothetical protein
VIPIVAVLVALACAAASGRRLWFAANATAFHPDDAIDAVKKGGIDALRAAAEKEPAADWERDLLAALAHEDEKARVALVNEQLTELDYRIQKWAKVPRICARIAASFAFLLATLVLRQGLVDGVDILSGDLGELVRHGFIGDALAVAIMGFAGMAFCITAASHSKRMAQERTKAADRLVEMLEKAARS